MQLIRNVNLKPIPVFECYCKEWKKDGFAVNKIIEVFQEERIPFMCAPFSLTDYFNAVWCKLDSTTPIALSNICAGNIINNATILKH